MKYKTNRMLGVVAATIVAALVVFAAEQPDKKWPRAQKGIEVFSQPEDQVVPANGHACFTVVAVCEDLKKPKPLYFKWKKNGTDITGTSNVFGITSPSLLISNAQTADVGFYTCAVSIGSSNSPSIIVGGTDPELPGAQLFVYRGTNTAVSGPYAPGTGTKTCMGGSTFTYVGRATMKWPGGSTWISRPSGKTHGQGLETTGLGAPYASIIQVVDNALWDTCGVSVVTFPASALPKKYQYTIYVTAGAPPLGTSLTLTNTWLP
jgi:hypothetical protein